MNLHTFGSVMTPDNFKSIKRGERYTDPVGYIREK